MFTFSRFFALALLMALPFDAMLSPNLNPKVDYVRTVVVDAGHGGKDSGALGAVSKEKDIALSVALKVAAYIRENFPNVKVIMTRDTDVFIELRERARIANDAKADLFISIHCNAVPGASQTALGTEVYIMGTHVLDINLDVAKRENEVIYLEDDFNTKYGGYDPNSPEGHILLSMFQDAFQLQSMELATKLDEQFKNLAKRKSRGVKQAGFWVLKATAMPSVLIETGYITTRKEESFLNSASGQEMLAVCIYRAFCQYKGQAEGQDLTHLAERVKLTLSSPPAEPVKEPVKPAPVNPEPVKPIKPDLVHSGNEPAKPNNTPNKPAAEPTVVKPAVQVETKPSVVLDAKLIEFRVQVAASPTQLNLQESKWGLVPGLMEALEDGKYKYLSQAYTSFSEANAMRGSLASKGFKDCFVVAYQQGLRVDINKAKLLRP